MVRNQDIIRNIDRTVARVDERIANLEDRRSNLKGAIDGADAEGKLALISDHRDVQIEIRRLKSQRADLEAILAGLRPSRQFRTAR